MVPAFADDDEEEDDEEEEEDERGVSRTNHNMASCHSLQEACLLCHLSLLLIVLPRRH